VQPRQRTAATRKDFRMTTFPRNPDEVETFLDGLILTAGTGGTRLEARWDELAATLLRDFRPHVLARIAVSLAVRAYVAERQLTALRDELDAEL